MIDIYARRRGKILKCEWYKAKTISKYDLTDLIAKNKPNDIFYSIKVTPKYDRTEIVNDTFKYSKDELMIKTSDKIEGIEDNDVVKIQGNLWRVTDVQVQDVWKQSEYGKDYSKETYLRLRK